MLYAWGAWLIFFFARERIPAYIEDPTLKGTTMNLKTAFNLAAFATCAAGWTFCHIREQRAKRLLDEAWTACYENDQDYMDTFHHPEK